MSPINYPKSGATDRILRLRLMICVVALCLVACDRTDEAELPTPIPTVVGVTADPAQAPLEGASRMPETPPTPTLVPPTPTPDLPAAAVVNGEKIYLDNYERELARYESAFLASDAPAAGSAYRQLVLDALIERTLIRQAATARGLQVSPAAVDAKLGELKGDAGEAANFAAWLTANGWSEEEFREALADEMLTEQMVAAITADVPYAVEQVRARYLQVDGAELAAELLARARAGDDFAFLARQFSLDRVTGENGGDLGYFARDALLVPAVEEAAFALSEGEISDVIAVPGNDGAADRFYLVQVIERQAERPLTPDERSILLQRAFEAWLNGVWQDADIIRALDEET